LGLSAP